MKKSILARGFVGSVASLLGVLAVGCGADVGTEGAAGEGEIGSVEQALDVQHTVRSLADAVLPNGSDVSPDPVARRHAATCVIKDGAQGTFKILLVGGYTTAGAGLGDAYLFTPPADPTDPTSLGSWKKVDSLPEGQERGEHSLLQISETTCLMAAGKSAFTGGSLRTQAYLFTADGTDGAWSEAGTITGRAKHQMDKCGTGSKAIIVGGENANGSSQLNSVQVYNGETSNTAWGALTTLNTARASFAMASENKQDFFIHSGFAGTGTVNSIELLRVSSSCELSDLNERVITGGLNPVGGKQLFGQVAFPTGTANTFTVTAGDDATNLNRDADRYLVNFSTSAITRTAVANALPSNEAARYPTLVQVAAAKFMILGGEDRSAGQLAAAPQPFGHQFTNGVYDSPSEDLSVDRLGAPASYLSGPNRVYIATGRDTASTTLVSVEQILPE